MRFTIGLFCVLAILPPLCGAEVPEVAKEAIASHTASLALLSSLQAKVDCEVTWLPDSTLRTSLNRPADEKRLTAGQFTRSGQQVRIDELKGADGVRTILKDFTTGKASLRLAGKLGQAEVVSTDAAVNSNIDLCNGCLYFLLRPIPPNYETHVTLEQAIAKSRRVSARREKLDGRDTIYLDLEMADDGSRFQVWLDLSVNCLWRRIVNTPRGKPGGDLYVREFCELRAGVFCPSRIEKIVPDATKSTIVLTDIKSDVVVAPKVFTPPRAPGTFVTDYSEGKVYQIDQNGQPTKVVTRIIPSETSVPSDSTPSPTALFADEPKTFSWSRIVLVASLVSAVVGTIMWYRRRAAA